MTPWKYSWVTLLALFSAMPAMAQNNQPTASKAIRCDQYTAAQLASSQALSPPGGTLYANFFPECVTNGTNGVCIRFSYTGTASSTTSQPLGASLQFYLGETALAKLQVILDSTATGASTKALTVCYLGN